MVKYENELLQKSVHHVLSLHYHLKRDVIFFWDKCCDHPPELHGVIRCSVLYYFKCLTCLMILCFQINILWIPICATTGVIIYTCISNSHITIIYESKHDLITNKNNPSLNAMKPLLLLFVLTSERVWAKIEMGQSLSSRGSWNIYKTGSRMVRFQFLVSQSWSHFPFSVI